MKTVLIVLATLAALRIIRYGINKVLSNPDNFR